MGRESKTAWDDYDAERADARAAANPDPHEERYGENAPRPEDFDAGDR